MKKLQQLLFIMSLAALLSPMLANADIYKWKDKNGVTRYSDSPPPAAVKKVDTIKAKAKTPPKQAVSEEQTKKVGTQGGDNEEFIDSDVDPEQEAARIRAQKAEVEKRKQEEKKAQAKANKQNCKAAKSRYQSYDKGGRIFKTNQKGEREFMGDKDLKAGKIKAKSDIRKYCK